MKTCRLRIVHWFTTAMLVSPVIAHADTFSHDFEGLNHNTVTTFTLVDGNLSAEFSGGTAFTVGVGALYRSGSKSWMLNPMGSSQQGTSTGVGTITFSAAATQVVLYLRNQNVTMTSTLQVIDENDGIIEEFTGSDSDWQEINISRVDGDPLIKSIKLMNNGPSGMVAIDDLSFTTAMVNNDYMDSGDDSSSGGGALSTLLLFLFTTIFGLRRWREQANYLKLE